MFKLNPKAHYAPYGKHKKLITGKDLSELEIVVQDDNDKSAGFKLKVPDAIFDLNVYKYYKAGDRFEASEGVFYSRAQVNFSKDPMKLWETQLNFAVHCATSAIGVCTEHLNAKEPLVRSLYRFHVYYHIRRILKRMLVPTPSEEGFDKYNNAYDLKEVRRIGDEYGCSTKNLHVYKNSTYFERTGMPTHGYNYAHNNWSRWIMNSSHGFTKHGLEKISDSIRAYSYLVLTSQSAARHAILGKNAQAITAQRLFYDNLEDVINKSVSLQDDIARYQSVLKYARSNLDYSVGEGLYMLPSDMLLKPLNQVIDGYNDKIVLNTSGHALGRVIPQVKKALPQKTAKPLAVAGGPLDLAPSLASLLQRATNQRATELQSLRAKVRDHEDEKQALTLALVGLALFAVWCS